MTALPSPCFPAGFLAAGVNAGIKNRRRDLGVLVSDRPSVFAACVTQNRCRAASAERTAAVLGTHKTVRGVLVTSGNANALTGPEGIADDAHIARQLADALGVDEHEVLTASTGVIGHRLPVARVLDGIESALKGLTDNPLNFAESIMTTDRDTKIFARELFVLGTRVQLHLVAKGSGMIAPALATTLGFFTTDAAISKTALQSALSMACASTLNQLTVDGATSTNDLVVAMANGASENEIIEPTSEDFPFFCDAMKDLFEEAARAIAKDGEGATRMITIDVARARSLDEARALSRAVAGSMLVKASIFGGDPYAFGRVLAALGAEAARVNAAFDVKRLSVSLQSVVVFQEGRVVPLTQDAHRLRQRMNDREIAIEIDLGQGEASARAWGCDLTYDYVKINADYARATTTEAGSVSVQDRLAELGPSIKKSILLEALKYIERFDGLRAVIKLGGAAMLDRELEEQFAEDVVLLHSVGLRPIVVHGGGPEISRTLERLGHKSEFVDGLRVTDAASMAVVEMVLTGAVNQRLVAALNQKGQRGVGLSGKDGGLLRARKLVSDRDLGQVGEVVSVNVALIDMLERDGYIPVVSPVGLGEDGDAYNINADVVAAELAVALKAPKLIYLSDVPGLLEGDMLVGELNADRLKTKLESAEITGGMIPKLRASLHALRGGVECVHLVDGRVVHNLIAELFTDRGVGTLIRQS